MKLQTAIIDPTVLYFRIAINKSEDIIPALISHRNFGEHLACPKDSRNAQTDLLQPERALGTLPE